MTRLHPSICMFAGLGLLCLSGCDEPATDSDVSDFSAVQESEAEDGFDSFGEFDVVDQADAAAVLPGGLIGPFLRTCDTSYVPPSVYPPIDPVPLLAGAVSDCAVGTNEAPCAPHHVYGPSPVRERDPLFVFLPGSNMEPDKHDQILLTAASTGYRSIGLSYDNSVKVADACAGQLDCGLDCSGDMREEVVRGVDTSANVDVTRGDSIIVRLYRVLEELDTTDPGGGWADYYVPTAGSVNASNILWENIILGGFSQGAGHAAFISRHKQVHGLFIIDGGGDTCNDPVVGELPAEWLTTGVDASAGRPKYGLRHDHGTGHTTNTASWVEVGLGTSLTSVDCTAPAVCDVIDTLIPPQATVTAHAPPPNPVPLPFPGFTCNDHNSMARDECLPVDFAGSAAAIAADDARLFHVYARRMCYACDAATCP